MSTCTTGQLLQLDDKPAVVAAVGCGGKTTLIETMARAFSQKKVLIAPTTKIRTPTAQVPICKSVAEALAHAPVPGRQYMGILEPIQQKLHSLPLDVLAQLVPDYHLTLLEADGSRGLYWKGWRADEPVVPHFATHTVGIVTLRGLGQIATEKTVCRLPEFTALTGVQEGQPITLDSLTAMVCHEHGMFRNSRGKEILLVGSVEDALTAIQAEQWLQEIEKRQPGRFFMAYGSAKLNQWQEVSL